MPCEHKAISIDIKEEILFLTCMNPYCMSSTKVHMDDVGIKTLLELTADLVQDSVAHQDSAQLS